MTPPVRSKLSLRGERISVNAHDASRLVQDIFQRVGCDSYTAQTIAAHLTDSSLCGLESHGLMRTLQYAQQFRDGTMNPLSKPFATINKQGSVVVDGNGGIGIPAMQLAYERGMQEAKENGICALAIRNVGHTGRHGAFADQAAQRGYLTFCTGGGNRKKWRQVAPYGGARPMLPTNPWCAGIPGGSKGPVVMDFATSKIAGGWIYAAKSADALLPEGCVIDADGIPTRNPDDYFNGGAILPAGQQKGYALALIAELIGEAMLGPSTVECHWLLITIDTTRFREPSAMQHAAEDVLHELRNCPAAPGFDQVEIPGEREREYRDRSGGVISIPEETWQQILALQTSLI